MQDFHRVPQPNDHRPRWTPRTRMLGGVLGVLGLTIALSACGLVNSFIPNQDVQDPLGLDGQPVTLDAVQPAGQAALAPQALSVQVSGAFVGHAFNDVDVSDIPAGIGPKRLVVDVALGTTATLSSATGALPDTVMVTAADLTLTVKDGTGSPTVDVAASAEATTGLLTLEKLDPSCVAATGCDYSVTPADPDDALITVDAKGSAFSDLWKIVTTGDQTNSVSGSFTLTLGSNVPADVSAEVTFSAPTGTLMF